MPLHALLAGIAIAIPVLLFVLLAATATDPDPLRPHIKPPDSGTRYAICLLAILVGALVGIGIAAVFVYGLA